MAAKCILHSELILTILSTIGSRITSQIVSSRTRVLDTCTYVERVLFSRHVAPHNTIMTWHVTTRDICDHNGDNVVIASLSGTDIVARVL